MANICRSLRKKFFCSPVLKSPTHIGFIGVKKMGQKSHTWAPLNFLVRSSEFKSDQGIKSPCLHCLV
jgi:hypothetical protein